MMFLLLLLLLLLFVLEEFLLGLESWLLLCFLIIFIEDDLKPMGE